MHTQSFQSSCWRRIVSKPAKYKNSKPILSYAGGRNQKKIKDSSHWYWASLYFIYYSQWWQNAKSMGCTLIFRMSFQIVCWIDRSVWSFPRTYTVKRLDPSAIWDWTVVCMIFVVPPVFGTIHRLTAFKGYCREIWRMLPLYFIPQI